MESFINQPPNHPCEITNIEQEKLILIYHPQNVNGMEVCSYSCNA